MCRLLIPALAQIGGGGTYAALGARIWLPPSKIGVIVDRGHDFPQEIQNALKVYGEAMWSFRDDSSRTTTRAMNSYRGEKRGWDLRFDVDKLLTFRPASDIARREYG